jgi:hypothetical protein
MSVHISLRIPAPELEQIDNLAREHDMNRTEYLTRAALGQLTNQRTELTNRVTDTEQRLDKLETWKQSVIDSQGNW